MPHRAASVGVLVFAAFMDLMDATVVNVALPSIQRGLRATPAELESTVGGYTLAFAALLITAGRLGDMVGRRRVFVAGVLAFAATSLLAAVAPTAPVLVLARVLQGAAAALMVPQLLSTVQALFSPRERPAVYGVVGGVSGLAAVAGPLLGGWLVTSDAFGIGWRSIFTINVPIGVALAVLALAVVPDTRADQPLRPDLLGAGASVGGVALVVYALVEGRPHHWSAWIWVLGGAGVALLVGFVAQQRRRQRQGRSPLVPTSLFTERGFAAGVLVQGTFQAGVAALAIVLALYLQVGLGYDAIGSGLALLPFAIGAFVGCFVAVPLGTAVGRSIVVLGALLMAGSVGWLAAVVGARGDALSNWSITPPLALAGVGLGFVVVPLVDIALATVPGSDAGAASGVFGTAQQAGAALGVAVAGVVFFRWTVPSAAVLRHALLAAAWVPGVAFALAAVVACFLPRRDLVRAHAAQEAQWTKDDVEPVG